MHKKYTNTGRPLGKRRLVTCSSGTKRISTAVKIFQNSYTLILPLIHSFNPSYDRSTANSPHSATYCFLFQFPVPSLSLEAVQQLLTSSFSSPRHFYNSCIFPSVTCCAGSSYGICDQPSQLSFLFTACTVGYSSPPLSRSIVPYVKGKEGEVLMKAFCKLLLSECTECRDSCCHEDSGDVKCQTAAACMKDVSFSLAYFFQRKYNICSFEQ